MKVPSRYRALVVKESKGDDGLYAAVLEQFPLTKPAPGEATVRVIAASLNRRTLELIFVKIELNTYWVSYSLSRRLLDSSWTLPRIAI